MPGYVDLDILLSRTADDAYTIELRSSDPEGVTSAPVSAVTRFDLAKLRAQALDPAAYGRLLTDSLFGDPALRGYYLDAFGAAFPTRALRLRLIIDRRAPELHSLRWETLQDPRDNFWLLSNENLLFSRLLTRPSLERIQLRPQGKIKVLALIANPSDISDFQPGGQALAPVDVTGELDRLRKALGGLPLHALATDPAKPGQASLDNLIENLRQGYDVLYIACHGALLSDQDPPGPYLWLEAPDGSAALVPGLDLVARLNGMPAAQRPLLVVLASCESAGTGRTSDLDGALAAIGPQLAMAGIPAVLANQGSVSMETIAGFMPVFFKQLLSHGAIDRAAAAARAVISGRPDASMPVLFLSLRSGSLWYAPGFADERPGFDRFAGLKMSMDSKLVAPILGPGLSACLLGDRQAIARQWSDAHSYPLQESSRDELPQVAQYLVNSQESTAFPRALLINSYTQALESCFQTYNVALPSGSLEQQMAALWKLRADADPDEPYRALASMPVAVYINTNPDNFLEAALRARNLDPVVEVCRWNPTLELLPPAFDASYYPSPKRPLIYHLFGSLREPDSLVLSEDDYFDYLMWVNKPPQIPPSPGQLPTAVDRAWSSHSLVFLGFELYDWNFRVLLRSILNEQRRVFKRKFPSVAVQLNPDESYHDPERTRRYLETFFTGMKMGIYWGSAQDFTKQLAQSMGKGSAK